ncbi:MAG: membrane lipoprotein lipid attachment site-containing protein [Lutibacter sp.]|uniref:hypothetical protein n=1 Tax=Lutibacter sp. TaxID=1925666 RepID=UPI0017C36BA8|nr:hypothetical protein [Lutibacter sp.]MBT8317539.1 hypothetical protein [Lutibacter sp.]NNJ58398.1 membrane lipoprotein lipid attachment site-containing protein [Lutibacter sp.]
MKKIVSLILAVLLITSCSKQQIKIPMVAEPGIQEIQNHSQVWMFLDIKNNDTIADVNRKNTISTTHWIYNIDKHLRLNAIIPSVVKLQYKHKNSFHSEEGMHDYYSYSDTTSKKLSFLEFDAVIYKTDSTLSKSYIKENSETYKKYNNINVTFNPNNTWINDAKMENGEFKTTLLEFIDFSSEGNQTMLHLNFNDQLSYQDYLFYKTMLHNFNNPAILINPIEFIFDQDKVPDCGCE